MKEEDKELDHLFKKRLQDAENIFAYNEEDWMALEARLDKKDKNRVVLRWLRIGSGIAAMLLLAFGWWFFGSTDLNNNPATVKKVKQSDDKISNQPIFKSETQKNDNELSLEKTLLTHNSIPKKHKVSVPTKQLVQNLNTQQNTEENSIASTVPAAKKEEANAAIVIAAVSPEINNSVVVQQQVANNVNTTQVVIDAVLPTDSSSSIVEPEKIKKPKTGKTKRPILFAISAVASSDLNGTSSLGQAKVGNNYGALLNVSISKKITIQTGLIYSNKPYQGNFNSYISAYGSNPYATKYVPTSINVVCKMFDLPLNIDYRFFENEHNVLSFGTGLSSYFMLHENYQYNFEPVQYASKNYEVPNSKTYLFSILNLNATYERKLNQRIGVMVQPYYKLPLRDIGYGSVKLHSVGLSVGLRLNLNNNKLGR
ncbi:hypothetical protein GM921_04145 [Pedobacter sp. LMG 31464]|uniref:Outer membrane protein beta-barrel domain-containing protein n=1 Tax=Pedobacter planticolens TaxID=2679964 RepID=A0A923ITE6_9SPHI|nr:hypothetical protein [Pedobacter planticolens]MBB2144660.1 hypothetical protein [Pedobacter planticolens]